MKKLLILLLIITALCWVAPVSAASDVSSALYTATIRAENNSTLAENVAGILSLPTSTWVTNGFLNASANNTVTLSSFGEDTPFMPGYDSNPWCFWYDSVAANSYNDANLYTGGDITGGSLAYFPGATGMTRADTPAMEPGNDFKFELSGYIDTTAGANKYIIYKDSSISLYVDPSTSGTITCDTNISGTITLYPDGAGDATGIPNATTPAAHWQDVDDPADSPDDASSKVYSNGNATAYTDYYTLQDGSLTANDKITSVTVYHRGRDSNYGIAMYTNPILRLSGVDTTGSTVTYNGYTSSYSTYSEALSRPGGGSWTYADIPNLQVGLTVRGNTNPETMNVTQVYVVVAYTKTVSITAVPSGEYTLLLYNSGDGTVHLDIPNTSYTASVSTGGGGIPNNGNTWVFCDAAPTPYVYYMKFYADHSTLQQSIAWNYGATFTDLTGHGYNTTPTFRTTTSDADVTLSLNDFSPVSLAQVSYETTQEWPTMATAAPDEPSTSYSENTTPGIFFGPIIHTLATAADIPESLFWYFIAFVIIMLAGMVSFNFFAKKNNTAALVIKFIVMLTLMIAWALPGLNVYGFYVVIYFIFWGFGLLVLSKSYGW